MDNIYVLNHLVQRVMARGNKKEKVFALFVDLKGVFDKVDRVGLLELMESQGIDEEIIKRIKKIYEETIVTVRTAEGYTDMFKTQKGVRQGCVMSLLLFNLYIADIDKWFKERNIGGVELGNERVWTMSYADDMVTLVKNRDAMLDMKDTLGRFLKQKKMVLSVEKTKMLVFNRKRKEKKERWGWGKEYIEEVQMFKYLGFMFNKDGNYKDHIKELCRKGRMAANKVWWLGERICRDDFVRRWMLFKYLVQNVLAYGVEIWGWEDKNGLEKIMMDYLRWVFRLEFFTPRYLIYRELASEKLKVGVSGW